MKKYLYDIIDKKRNVVPRMSKKLYGTKPHFFTDNPTKIHADCQVPILRIPVEYRASILSILLTTFFAGGGATR